MSLASSAGVARITIKQALVGDRGVIVFRCRHELKRFGNNGRITEIDQKFGEIAVNGVLSEGKKWRKTRHHGSGIFRCAQTGEGERVGAEPAKELVLAKRL